jgi:putative transcriptional regulator
MKGRLLIATPTLLDPNFRRTVVLLLEHTPDGAIGVVLNRPSDTEAREAVPDLRAVLLDDEPIFLGGPVQPETVIALADHTDPLDDDGAICGSIASLEFDDDPDRLQASVSRARVFAGYAGWESGQLEGEIEEEAWFTEEALPLQQRSGAPLVTRPGADGQRVPTAGADARRPAPQLIRYTSSTPSRHPSRPRANRVTPSATTIGVKHSPDRRLNFVTRSARVGRVVVRIVLRAQLLESDTPRTGVAKS